MKGCEVMKIPSRTVRTLLALDNPVGRGRRATLMFDIEKDPGQLCPLDDQLIEARMIKLLLLEMAKNEAPPEQYIRLGLPEPRRLKSGHSDECIELPSDEEISLACVLTRDLDQQGGALSGNGEPLMNFPKWVDQSRFPENLRLRAGYRFSRVDETLENSPEYK